MILPLFVCVGGWVVVWVWVCVLLLLLLLFNERDDTVISRNGMNKVILFVYFRFWRLLAEKSYSPCLTNEETRPRIFHQSAMATIWVLVTGVLSSRHQWKNRNVVKRLEQTFCGLVRKMTRTYWLGCSRNWFCAVDNAEENRHLTQTLSYHLPNSLVSLINDKVCFFVPSEL